MREGEKEKKNLFNSINACQKCSLHQKRLNVVVGQGTLSARVMLIGEAPGKEEDESGLPFQGRSGRLLRLLLEEADFDSKQDLYIANTLKCRPPSNRKPKKIELEACSGYLEKQIILLNPDLILLCGATALQRFLPKKAAISKIRGTIFNENVNFREQPLTLMPLFHPAYLLRNPSKETGKPLDLMRQDLRKAKNYILENLNE